jgi:hypothetical protein
LVTFFSGKRVFDPQFIHDQLDRRLQQPGRPVEMAIDECAIDARDGGTAIPYDEEDRSIRAEYEETLKREGGGSRMVDGCFGGSRVRVERGTERLGKRGKIANHAVCLETQARPLSPTDREGALISRRILCIWLTAAGCPAIAS